MYIIRLAANIETLVGGHRGVMAGDRFHVSRIVGLRGEHHIGGGIQDASHQLIQISVNLLSRIRRGRFRRQGLSCACG